ncbi:MAG: hypothetical protein IPH62_14235 [Ignavibacteriae bacterium]|nr:hypothetical protein [Ignavibacteriota bacterium]
MSSINRRKFFNKISLSAIGTLFLSSFPLNIFGTEKKKSFKNIKVKIHPDSVKRNK